MTTQAGDILLYNGKKTTIASEPLKPYLETREDVSFILKSTAIVRGYIGNWEIKNNKLFLISLLGFIEDQEQVDLNFLFPDKNEVFADWFTGDIRIPQGKMIKKVKLGYESTFEKDLILKFEKGLFIEEIIV